MPRAPSSTKLKRASGSGAAMRHAPLHAEILSEEQTKRFGTVSQPGRRARRSEEDGEDEEEEALVGSSGRAAPPGGMIRSSRAGGSMEKATSSKFVDPKLSRNILRLARAQQDEIEAEEAEEAGRGGNASAAQNGRSTMRDVQNAMGSDDEEEESGFGGVGKEDGELGSDEEDVEEEYEELEIDPEDEELMRRFETGNEGEAAARRGNKTLADIIMEKIDASAEAANGQGNGIHEREPRKVEGAMPMPPGINPKVIEVYTKVGELLSRYKSGPLPKAFKIIPSLPAWENILYITDPSSWTPHATLAATRIFVSNLKVHQSQRFFKLVLLDKVRDEIAESGKVSYQTYEAIKKAVFKPAAFFKGFLFPLCETGCTLKEAAIVSSVLTRVSIPILHSAAALLHLAEMHYAGPTSLFIRVLLDKKHALPYKVVDALVFHFLRFADPDMGVEKQEGGGRRMPVLWHQSLLVFCQRYKQDLTPDQKAALLDLLRVQRHEGIGPDVRRELTTGKARGEMLDEPLEGDDEDMSI